MKTVSLLRKRSIMENKIVSIYLSLAYCAILWAACQPPPALKTAVGG
jgi:hypothetical protein